MANPIVAFNDSPVGIILSTALHTLGAVGFLGGLVGYVAWRRHLALGHHHRRVLEGAATLTYVAILVNLLGGFMRTFESDHPTLEQFGESPWVRAIAIKHVFLFVGMAAAAYLFEIVAPRLIKAHKEGRLAQASLTGHRVGVAFVVLGIVVAGVLGGVSAAYPPVAMTDHPDVAGPSHDTYYNASGQLTTNAIQPATSTGEFEVMNGTLLLNAQFTWAPTNFALSVDLHGPDGKLVTISSANGQAESTLDQPAPGHWTYTVRADLAAGANWQLKLRMAYSAGHVHAE